MLSTSILYCNKIGEHPGQHEQQPQRQIPPSPPVPVFENGTGRSSPTIIRPPYRVPITDRSSAISDTLVSSRPSSGHRVGKINSRFRVQYLGCNTCDYRNHKPDNGIASYQKPLLDLYATVLRRSVVLRSLLTVNQVADLSGHGIVIAEKDRFQSRNQQQPQPEIIRPGSSASGTTKPDPSPANTVVTKVITPLTNIVMWAAVRLQHRTHVRKTKNNGSPVKRRQIGVAFVPLSCSEAVLDKNAFVTLNSKQRFLLGLPHSPLFVCVLQKINSNQRLECHLFVCPSSEDAISMCNRMDELRHRSSSIGRLQIPPPGQMGKYSYQNSHRSGSSVASIITNRSYSPSQTMSELSLVASSRPRFSDIEEEDGETETEVKKLIGNYQSNIVTTTNNNANNNSNGIKILNNGNGGHKSKDLLARHIAANNGILKMKGDTRLYDRTLLLTCKVNNSIDGGGGAGVGGGLSSVSELSSVSSKSISTAAHHLEPIRGAGPLHQRQAVMAKRDYRFEAYSSNGLKSTAAGSVDGKSSMATSSHVKTDYNQQKAILTPTPPPPLNHHHHRMTAVPASDVNGHPKSPQNSNKWLNDISSNKSDELRKNRLFVKASGKSNSDLEPVVLSSGAHSNGGNSKTFFGDSLPRNGNLNLVEWKITPEEISNNNNDNKQNNRTDNDIQKSNRRPERSIISNSIFLDHEESSSSSKSAAENSKKTPENSNKSGDDKHVESKTKCETEKVVSNNVEEKKTELPQNNNNSSKTRQIRDPSKMLLLSDIAAATASATNLGGVKGFNKSSRVESWSTMIPSNSCDLCNMELNCDECCTFCQAIEQHKRQNCQECLDECNLTDDFLLDENTMKNFNRDGCTLYHHNTAGYSESYRSNRRPEIPPPPMYPTFLGRIRRLTWQSLFGPKKKIHGYRIWNRLRTGSQRLKGSKRYLQNKSRIFLPNGSPPGSKKPDTDTKVMYDEHYMRHPLQRSGRLSPPPSGSRIRSTDNKNGGGKTKTTDYARMNGKIIETNLDIGRKNVPRETTNGRHGAVRSSPLDQSVETQPLPNRVGSDSIIKPFFISHPGKKPSHGSTMAPNGLIDANQNRIATEFGLNGISISSDSGMDECDCHSSAEHSPSGYHHRGSKNLHQPSRRPEQLRQAKSYDAIKLPPPPTSKATNYLTHFYSQNHLNHHHHLGRGQQQQSGKQLELEQLRPRNDLPPPPPPPPPPNEPANKAIKDIRRQAGHWSQTNIESQLGYMP